MVVATSWLFELRFYSQQGCWFVRNGLDRSGIDTATAILYKIVIIEYNIHKSESEQASQFPTPSFRVSQNSKLCGEAALSEHRGNRLVSVDTLDSLGENRSCREDCELVNHLFVRYGNGVEEDNLLDNALLYSLDSRT